MPRIAVSIKAESRYCVSGMTVQNRPEYSSKLDKDICEEFANDWEALYLESQRILANKKKVPFEEMIDLGIESEWVLWPKGEYYDAQVKLRMGQFFFLG